MGKVTLPMSELYLQKCVCVCVSMCVCVCVCVCVCARARVVMPDYLQTQEAKSQVRPHENILVLHYKP